MFLNILVTVDGSAPARRALEQAVDLARTSNAKLTLITVAPPLSMYMTLAGVTPTAMERELDDWAGRVLDEAAAIVPDEVIAHRVQHRGHAGPEILTELRRGGYDLVVLGSRGRGRAPGGPLGLRQYLRSLPQPGADADRPRGGSRRQGQPASPTIVIARALGGR